MPTKDTWVKTSSGFTTATSIIEDDNWKITLDRVTFRAMMRDLGFTLHTSERIENIPR